MTRSRLAFELDQGLLVLTDRDSADTLTVYDGRRGVEAGQSALVFRQAASETLIGDGDPGSLLHEITVVVQVDGTRGRLGNLWSGELSFPSGVLVFSDWPMRQVATLDIEPGRYRVDIHSDKPDDPSMMLISLAAIST